MGKIITGIHGLESFTKLAKSRGICIYLIVWKPSLKSVWVLYEPGNLVKSSLEEYQIQDMYYNYCPKNIMDPLSVLGNVWTLGK